MAFNPILNLGEQLESLLESPEGQGLLYAVQQVEAAFPNRRLAMFILAHTLSWTALMASFRLRLREEEDA